MPWYWTDDIARVLESLGRIGGPGVDRFRQRPVAIRRAEETIEDVVAAMLDDGEIPLAA